MAFSLSEFYLKRVLTHGKWYLIIGLAFPVAITLAILFEGKDPYTLSSAYSSYTFVMPITGLWGMIPMVFYLVSDRRTGFYEHIFATTELRIQNVYGSLIKDSILITSIPVAFTFLLSLGLGLYGIPLPPGYLSLIMAYSLPVSYITPLFALVVAATWSFTTRIIRGPFTSAPAGFLPLIGIVIVLIPLYLQDYIKSLPLIELMGFYSLAIFILFLAVLVIALRIMKPERLLP